MKVTEPTDTINATAGATFAYNGEARLVHNAETIIDYTGWGIACHIRDHRGKLLSEVACAWSDATRGLFTLTVAKADTVAWQPGRYYTDIQFTTPDGSVSVNTPPTTVIVRAGITHDV